MAFLVGVLAGAFMTTKTAAAFCVGDLVDLIDPVVTVVVGPGDPAAEEDLWSTFEHVQVFGPRELHVDGARADLVGGP